MQTTTELTKQYLKEHPSIKDCLKHGIINYSKLSRKIAKELDIQKKTSLEAILIACRRYETKLKNEKILEDKILGILKRSELEIKNKIAVVIIDKNNFQLGGPSNEIMGVGDLVLKWKSFGWDTVELDGHNIGELYDGFNRVKAFKKPAAIIANTIKGKGVSFAENNAAWHHAPLSKSQYEAAMLELNKELGGV